jgi:hypothetical protein
LPIRRQGDESATCRPKEVIMSRREKIEMEILDVTQSESDG